MGGYPDGHDYLSTLSNTKFCFAIRGVAGWAPRMVDAIYSGCIPVILTLHTHLGFMEALDFFKFGITVSESELENIEERLMSIPDFELE